MKRIDCIIVDDEPIAISILEKHIIRNGELQLLAKCPNALEAFDVLLTKQVDLMFLDIRMPSINGIDFLKSLKHPPKVIFTTAFSEHAIDGYELDAVDFLLKPITYERFSRGIERFLHKSPLKEPEEKKDYSFFKISGQLVKIFHRDIYYARSVKDYIQLRTSKGNFMTYMTMKQLGGTLPSDSFARVHRSYMVNRIHIDVMTKNSLIIMGDCIPIGKIYRSAFYG
ncbi:LytR/AlgR family response regulator transcription factor [Parapedobacter sp. GCM10030251]|uniref:LytR/AlgR family response regulator transcription factor n=1 Tax=Parapedobacter sp. GCM10030251 TaxID=3273419 RepID=UPI0036234FE5